MPLTKSYGEISKPSSRRQWLSRTFGACGNQQQVIIGFGEMMHRQVTAQIQIIIVEVVASAIILSFHKKVGEIIGRESFHTANGWNYTI